MALEQHHGADADETLLSKSGHNPAPKAAPGAAGTSIPAFAERRGERPVVRLQAGHLPGETLDSLPQGRVLRGLLLKVLPEGLDLLGVLLLRLGALPLFRPQTARTTSASLSSTAVFWLGPTVAHSRDSFTAGCRAHCPGRMVHRASRQDDEPSPSISRNSKVRVVFSSCSSPKRPSPL